jgi:outer membrane protein assembly factor BamB
VEDETVGPIYAAPAAVGETVFVGGRAETSYAFDANTGEERWRFEEETWTAAPMVAGDSVFIPRSDVMSALDAATGEERWRTAGIMSTPTVSNGILYGGTSFDGIRAVDAETGEVVWSYATGERVQTSPTIAGAVVYGGSDDSRLYALDAVTGERRWFYQTHNDIWSSPTVVDGVVYVGSNDGNLYAINTQGGGSSEGSRVNLGVLGHHGGLQGESVRLNTPTPTPSPSPTPTREPTETAESTETTDRSIDDRSTRSRRGSAKTPGFGFMMGALGILTAACVGYRRWAAGNDER